ncbi:MAG: serine/threonine-protein kinase [Myxococcales bacterium]
MEKTGHPTIQRDLEETLRSSSDAPLAPEGLGRGDSIGRFLVLEQLGAGGMGVVYAAYDPQLDRKVAIKLLQTTSAGSGGSALLLREAQALARLSHPNVVAIHDVGAMDREVFLAMELVDGVPASDWLARGPRPWRETLGVFLQAARGLAAAHAAGIVHRDFKPGNMLVGNDGRVRVLDFGLACGASEAARRSPADRAASGGSAQLLEAPLTRHGEVLGTPAYMSPEQTRGEPTDARTDQFSFCASLYEALYGEGPFAGATVEELWAAAQAGRIREAPRRGVPAWLHAVLVRGLSPDPSGRHPSMDGLIQALSRDPERRRRQWLTAAAAAVAISGLGAFAGSSPRPTAAAPVPRCRGAAGRGLGRRAAADRARGPARHRGAGRGGLLPGGGPGAGRLCRPLGRHARRGL